jgi:GMP synthase (glutamine-hydrolysing)
MKKALILKHVEAEGAGILGHVLNTRDIHIENLSAPRDDLSMVDPLAPDVLVIMGGPVGVYQSPDYPFLQQEIEIMKQRLAADKPVIGICLGAQIMAAALGAKVYQGTAGQELGWNELTLTPEGEQSAARHLCRTKTSMFHWHGDTFDLPENAVLLASSNRYKHQIFQHGKNALGLQCHAEVRTERLKEWEVMFVGSVTGPDAVLPIAKLRAETANHIEALNVQAGLFFNEWLEERGL